jgi:O-antigen/teichoic acid export membrane protein
LAQRELKGGHLARLEISSQLLAMIVTLGLALWTRSVWSLLIGTLVASGARTLMSHFYLPGKSARPCWDAASAREIIGFGKWIFVSSIIGFLAANGEKLILGGTLSTLNFGVFSIASTLLAAAIAVYGSLNAHVIFSSLSLAHRSNKEEVARVYTRVQQLADAFLAFFAGATCTAGQWAVWLLYDNRYHDAGWMLQWLGLTLLAIRHQVIEQYMFARGQPAWVSANNVLRTLGLFVLVPAGYRVAGSQGAIAGVVLSQFASWPLSLWFKHRHGLLTWGSEAVWPPVLALGMATGWLIDLGLRAWFRV